MSPLSDTSLRRPRVRDPATAREALVAAAERIFNRDGYFATNSNAIAREAGYAPATFYTHFADKLALFLSVYERWVRQEWEEIRSVPLAAERRAMLTAIVEAVISRHVRTAVFRRSLRALALLEPQVAALRNDYRSAQLERMLELGRSLGTGEAPIENRVLALIMIERLADAVADGETDALFLDVADVRSTLVSIVEPLLFGGGDFDARD